MINVIHGLVNHKTKEKLCSKLDRATAVRQVLPLGNTPKRPKINEYPRWMIAFTERDLQRFQVPHNDALVVTVQIETQDIRRALLDQGSSAEVMYYSLFKQHKIPETDFRPIEVLLVGFNRAPIWPLCWVTLPVKVGLVTLNIEFVVVNVSSPTMQIWEELGFMG